MSLDWDLTRIEDSDTVCWVPDPDREGERIMNGVTHGLIFMTMAIGIGEITQANAAEFYARAYAWETVYGSMMVSGEGDRIRVTPADIRAHIGLRTNIFPKRTDAAFAKQLLGTLKDDARRVWERSNATATV